MKVWGTLGPSVSYPSPAQPRDLGVLTGSPLPETVSSSQEGFCYHLTPSILAPPFGSAGPSGVSVSSF